MKTERLEAVRLYGGERRPFSVYRSSCWRILKAPCTQPSWFPTLRLHAPALGGKDLRLELKLRRYSPDVAGRLLIRSAFLGKIKEAFDRNRSLKICSLTPILRRR
jgi:hypothetical protein